MRVPRLFSIVAAIMLPVVFTQGQGDPASTLQRGWEELGLLNAGTAQQAFATAMAANPASREARLGNALAFLQLRSRTAGNSAAAVERLEDLRRENPDDDTGIAATYYLARIEQVHRITPNRPAAVAGYGALLAAHPSLPCAQLAAPNLALLLLYDDVPAPEWERRVTEIETLIPRLSTPEAVRDTRLILADAFIRLRHDHTRAYPLFAACLADATITRKPRLNGVLLQAAESAHQLGRSADEVRWYEQFLSEFPRDAKADEIHRRLASLPAPTAGSTEAAP
ncbi:MAG: hypothetical protein ABI222_10100 [Opitutaceae bacterium]